MGGAFKKPKKTEGAPKAKMQEAAQEEIVDTSFENESVESKKEKGRRGGGLSNVLG